MFIPADTYAQILECLPILCVDVLIFHKGKYLLLLRDNEPAKGTYWFPGGRIYKNEVIQDAAVRKAKEETALNVSFIKIVSVEETIFMKKEEMKTDVHTVNICCHVEATSIDNLSIDKLHANAIWIDRIDSGWHAGVQNPLRMLGLK